MTVVASGAAMGEKILRETGMLMVKEGMDTFTDGISDSVIKTKCCRKADNRDFGLLLFRKP